MVSPEIAPFDLEVDASGRFYLSDPAANKVCQLDASGRVTRTFGRLAVQKPGEPPVAKGEPATATRSPFA